ncbi:MurR/RpiR family transcriptional regulator [Nocardiopsis sp. N85]|uniref:MurR/RpiR family transcriptional regulator n=1 Tax=Nocardiopsis sp. N85 TaxID=3029400 RepID=UPI00237FC07F|nr:MurR/RpiR family transcriptional regulator [Nocardiopsis sp. N85]MDE3719831.1 MurR/RpiR family transcriptional regulator [Nocardiopsis sp. N85]
MAHIPKPTEGRVESGIPQVPTTVLRIRSLLPSLAPAERRVAQRIIDDPERAAASSITQLAKDCATSEATVIRFCRTIDFSGYRELRLALATEAGQARGARTTGGPEPDGDINPDDTLVTVVQKIAYTDARAVEETGAALNVDVLRTVIDTMGAARRIDVYGVGASAFVGADLQQKLHRIGLTSFAWSDAHVMLTSAALLDERDVAIGISHSGSTIDTVQALSEAGRRGARTVAITNFPRSPIGFADHVLTTAARETTFRSGATASRLAQLTVVDCLFVGLAQSRYTDSRTALETTAEAVRGLRINDDRKRRRDRSDDKTSDD